MNPLFFSSGALSSSGSTELATQLLDFDGAGADFARRFAGTFGEASHQTSENTFARDDIDELRTETLDSVSRFLLEREIQNNAEFSLRLDLGYSTTSVTVVDDQQDAPDGQLSNAGEFSFAASSTARIYRTINTTVIPTNSAITLSCWMRLVSGGPNIRLAVLDYDSVFQYSGDFVLTSDWQRFQFTFNDVGNIGTNLRAHIIGNSTGNAVVASLYGFQVEVGRYATSYMPTEASSKLSRYADSLSFGSAEVPLLLREGHWSCDVRPKWATADLVDGERRVLCSTDSNNWVGFEKDSGSLYLRCYTGGVLMFGTSTITIARETDYALECDLENGVMTLDGTAGATGTAATLPAGEALRWGGVAGGADEIDAGCSEPWSVV